MGSLSGSELNGIGIWSLGMADHSGKDDGYGVWCKYDVRFHVFLDIFSFYGTGRI